MQVTTATINMEYNNTREELISEKETAQVNKKTKALPTKFCLLFNVLEYFLSNL